jgi:hypothetical protein
MDPPMTTWGLVDDGMPDHPKVLELLEHPDGIAALGLWTLCLLWARRQAEQSLPERWGMIPASLPRRYLGEPGPQLAALLVEARAGHEHGLWEVNGSGWRIHDFAEWQQIEQWRAKRASQRRKALQKWHPDQPDLWGNAGAGATADAGGHATADAKADAAGMPISFHITSHQEDTSSASDRRLRPTPADLAAFDDFWEVYPRKVGKQAAVKAWAKAVTLADPAKIITAAGAYRDQPGREAKYTAHPTTWLNQGRWDDDDHDPGSAEQPAGIQTEPAWTPPGG